jgi:hypothetical protein
VMCLLPRHRKQLAMDARRSRYQMSTLICRISARRSAPIFGRAPSERDFQRQYLFIPRTPRDQSASAFLLSAGTRLVAC